MLDGTCVFSMDFYVLGKMKKKNDSQITRVGKKMLEICHSILDSIEQTILYPNS